MPERPNILFILTDDQGPWAAGCYGNEEIRTPAIDRIAAAGPDSRCVFIARGKAIAPADLMRHCLPHWTRAPICFVFKVATGGFFERPMR